MQDLAELGHVDVDVNLHRVLAEGRELAGDAVVPARADGHDEVAAVHRLVGVGGSVHAQHAQVKRVVFGHRTLAQQCIHDRGLDLLGKFQNGLARVRDHRAVADQENRPERLGQKRRRLLECHGVGVLGHVVAGQIDLVHEGRRTGRGQHILGQIDEHRPRSARARDEEGFLHHPRDVVHILDQEAVLDRGVGDARDVRLLEAVLAEHGANDLATQHDHGNRIGQGGEQAGHRVGGARPRGHHHDAGLAGGAGKAIGHVCGALLVPGEDQLDLRLVKGVEEWDGRATWQSKDGFDPFALEALYDFVAARGDLAGRRRLWGRLGAKVCISSRV